MTNVPGKDRGDEDVTSGTGGDERHGSRARVDGRIVPYIAGTVPLARRISGVVGSDSFFPPRQYHSSNPKRR